MTNEFTHYNGCGLNDPDNCSACALTDLRQDSPNYAGWPLVYIENDRAIPSKWRDALADELKRTDNLPYVDNLVSKILLHGVKFT